MKCKCKSGIRMLFLIGLLTLYLHNFSVNGQSNIEQDPVNTSRNASINQTQNNRVLQPAQQLIIPENLIQIQKVEVPPLIGRRFNFDEIAAFLDELGLQPGEAIPVSNAQQAGIVINQYPPAGRMVNPQTPINLTYGTQTVVDQVLIPRYIGLSVERAVARMPNDRLTPGIISEANSEMPPGIVVEQFPKEGLSVDPQTQINLSVSNGIIEEPVIRVPNLIGFSLQQAAEILKEAGLFAGEIFGRQNSVRPGTIIEQFPEPETEVRPNSTVNIVFSELIIEDFATVPNVVGYTKNEAIIVLKENNLRYAQQFVKNTGQPEGIVTGQDLPPGKKVPPGTTVVIQIQDKAEVPPWVFWGTGVLVAGVAGGFIGRKISGGKKKKIVGEKNLKPILKPVWDAGKQTITKKETKLIQNKIHLKYIPDKGNQTIKTN